MVVKFWVRTGKSEVLDTIDKFVNVYLEMTVCFKLEKLGKGSQVYFIDM